jgi:acyl-CoA synthetase (AMP-forming)/AMP-acid ligase II
VAILAENSLFGIAAYLGVLRAGATAVPLPPHLTQDHCRSIAGTTAFSLAFVQSRVLVDFAGALEGTPELVVDEALKSTLPGNCLVTSFDVLLAYDHPFPPAASCGANDLAVLLFTSGSTSEPRGVMISHGNLSANTRSILGYLGLTQGDRAMMVLPYYYSFGASLLHTLLAVGGSLVIDRRFMFPDKVLRRMQETRCTGFAGVPSHFQVLLRRSQFKQMPFPDLRWVQQAGGKLPAHFLEELADTLPAVRIFVMYGATEATARLCYLPPELLRSKLGSVGKAIPGVQLELLDEQGAAVAPGAIGEIVASGENIARGYFQAPRETEATFRNGRLHTGDLARADNEGFLYIVDRAKDFIKCAGNRTSTKMLEEVLLRFPDLVEAVVLGIPDETLGEAVAAFVVPRVPGDSTLAARLLAFAQDRLPPQLVPKQVNVLGSLPKNSAGKVLKSVLRANATPV